MTKKIIHIDMDAFYASIEQRDNPGLKGKPVIVGGSPEGRGVVAAASYEARKYGIHSAMPTWKAIKLCKNINIIRPNFEKYVTASRKINQIFREYTDIIEPLSLDEAYLDVTENKMEIPTATEVAIHIKEQIKKELNLTASAGVAPNKLLAKIASDLNKPDGIAIIKPHQVKAFMLELSVKRIWGVGKVTQNKLADMDVVTCGDLQKYSRETLMNRFGKFGKMLYLFARGIDDRPVITQRERKSIGAETTFHEDQNNMEFIKESLLNQVNRIHKRLTEKELKGRTITIKVRYADFTQTTRSKTINDLTDNLDEIYSISEELLYKTEAGNRDIRLIGVSIKNFDFKDKSNDKLLFE